MTTYSVLMSVYCKEKPEYLRESIESMLNQTIKPNQFVIVEDGKLPKQLCEVIDSYNNRYPNLFTVIKRDVNKGLGPSLDEGLTVCRNELVARMDSDDISISDRCEKELEIFNRHPEISIVSGTIAEFMDTTDNIICRRKVPEYSEDIKKQMRRRSGFNHPAVMYRKSVVIAKGGYGDSARKEDHDLFSRMMFGGCIGYNIQSDLLYYRTGSNNIARRKSLKNVSSYIQIMWINLNRGYCSLGDFIYVFCAQIFYLVAPTKLLEKVLKKYFRD